MAFTLLKPVAPSEEEGATEVVRLGNMVEADLVSPSYCMLFSQGWLRGGSMSTNHA